MRHTSVVLLAICLMLGLSITARAAKPTAFTIHTVVTSIDLGHSTITTNSKHHGAHTFSLAPKATIVQNGQIVGFGAIKVGDVIKVRYSEKNGALEASDIEIQGTPGTHDND